MRYSYCLLEKYWTSDVGSCLTFNSDQHNNVQCLFQYLAVLGKPCTVSVERERERDPSLSIHIIQVARWMSVTENTHSSAICAEWTWSTGPTRQKIKERRPRSSWIDVTTLMKWREMMVTLESGLLNAVARIGEGAKKRCSIYSRCSVAHCARHCIEKRENEIKYCSKFIESMTMLMIKRDIQNSRLTIFGWRSIQFDARVY